MRILRCLCLLTALAVALPSVRPAAAEERPLETIADVPSKGRLALVKSAEARKAERYGEAVAILQDIVDNHPRLDHYLVRFHLGNALVLAGRTAAAAVQYQSAVEKEPRHAPSWLSLGQAAFETGDYVGAAAALEQAFRVDAEPQAVWLYYAGVAYLQDGNPVDAGRVLREVCSGRHGRPGIEWLRAWLAAESQAGERDRGQEVSDRMLRLFPDDPLTWTLRAQLALQYEDYREAAVSLVVRDYLEPLPPDERVRLGDVLSAAQAYAWASRQYRAALGAAPGSDDYVRLVRALIAAHDDDGAVAVLSEALTEAPSFELWNMRGYIAYRNEDHEGVLEAFGRCLVFEPDFGRAHTLMGYSALELGRTDLAREHLEAALGFDGERETARGLLLDLRRREAEGDG